ncbi:MAG: KOW domain-containing RNA-binding protein [Tissierellia bacterium]|nr:KOW domain-containing RNA-binding protein [Tissierellia bacterium]MDD4726462.1 KOW domain-containing RNA-binding protein [Tissierellia bacterium]
MDLTDKLKVGQLVESRAGRDSGRAFIIYEILNENFVLVVDGDLRKLKSPKKKNIKHLMVYNKTFPNFKENEGNESNFNDAYIRKILDSFNRNV